MVGGGVSVAVMIVLVVVLVVVVVVVETGILRRRENTERGVAGGGWQVLGWELMVVAAVAGIGRGVVVVVIKVSMELGWCRCHRGVGESHKQRHRKSHEVVKAGVSKQPRE